MFSFFFKDIFIFQRVRMIFTFLRIQRKDHSSLFYNLLKLPVVNFSHVCPYNIWSPAALRKLRKQMLKYFFIPYHLPHCVWLPETLIFVWLWQFKFLIIALKADTSKCRAVIGVIRMNINTQLSDVKAIISCIVQKESPCQTIFSLMNLRFLGFLMKL